MKPLEVLSVASEMYPLVKTGGLADVVGALPAALAPEFVRVVTLLPGYPAVLAEATGATPAYQRADLFGGPARVLPAKVGEADILVLDAPHLYARRGGPYADASGQDWPDNAERFAALSRVAADLGGGALPGYRPDALHAHDWQAGLSLAYARYATPGPRPGLVATIHNLAFQGQFAASLFPRLGLPPETNGVDGLEYYGGVSFLKAGLQYADRITTVSPSYAAEIRTVDAGMGLDGVIRSRDGLVSGILNGLDTVAWDPATDPHIAQRFDATNIAARGANKIDLRFRFGLDQDPKAPLFGVVSRLSWQKGLDLLLEVIPALLATGGQLILLGSGEPALEAGFRAAAATYPGRIACMIGYDEAMAHRLHAGIDALLVPSRFEPCGLTQLCALRYGAVPVVARVGGLADTVVDANPVALERHVATGVQFAPVTAEMLKVAIERTVALYRQPATWRRMRKNGMATNVSWRDPARRYAKLFRDLAKRR